MLIELLQCLFHMVKEESQMLVVNEFKKVLLEQFYLDDDDITVRRKQNGWRNKYSKGDVVKPFKQVHRNQGYMGVHIPRTRKTIQMSHLITLLRGIDIPENGVIDHLDGNPCNNSRSNLRVITQHENSKNRVRHKNNTTGYSGISFNKQANLYTVRRTINKVRKYKSAKTLEEAVKILKEFEIEQLNDGYTIRHGK